jgi:hypothetical protein
VNIPGFPDPRKKTFAENWPFPKADVYWDPRQGKWVPFQTTKFTISNVGIPPPAGGDLKLKSPEQALDAVEQSWAAIKGQHPTVFFDPRETGWREITSRQDQTGDSTADLARRMRLAKPELDALDEELRERRITPQEYDRRHNEIKRKYGV